MQTEKKNKGEVETPSKKVKRLIKMAIPHIMLYLILFGYLMMGAWTFASVENQIEREEQLAKVRRVETIYRRISNEMIIECAIPRGDVERRFNEQLYESLSMLSQFMENKEFRLHPYMDYPLDKIIPPRWNAISSVLYALSILTTTGYGKATPITPLGQWLSIGYGLLGIPLMILAAVDIGRFLSDVVLFSYSKIERAIYRLSKLFGFSWPTSSMISQVETKAFKIFKSTRRRSFSSTKKNFHYEAMKNEESVEGRKTIQNPNRKAKHSEKKNAKHLPLWVNAAILLLFCMLGALVYIAAGGDQKTFIEGFFVTFNLVANLTMSEVPTDISHMMTIVYIFVFVTFGLAVLSMCADLAASELKWIFLKIHYFGRKINWKRKTSKKDEEQMQIEVTELLKIIKQIRAKYPDKHQITTLDILKYVQELDNRRFSNPYHTFNIFMQQHRRDTIAFAPRSIEGLKFADELEDLDETTAVWMVEGGGAEIQFSDAAGSGRTSSGELGDIDWSHIIRARSNPNTFIPFIPHFFQANNPEEL